MAKGDPAKSRLCNVYGTFLLCLEISSFSLLFLVDMMLSEEEKYGGLLAKQSIVASAYVIQSGPPIISPQRIELLTIDILDAYGYYSILHYLFPKPKSWVGPCFTELYLP